jgi:ribosomal protein L40E
MEEVAILSDVIDDYHVIMRCAGKLPTGAHLVRR